ncbi:organomercurial lyase [Corynebacterium pseudotuberculosis]|uniref:Alkylmercury lyase n=1 Tax=Corynebacterium pseudotuberculosis (strain C231) TaxID=681645 RepID=A0A6D2LED9_CORP2|nr:organomercurial lyase [Corynebacterium pseudotuberculosis]AEX39224.1 Alkylmercury lyase [Corynebacterium pseudotuberculosis 3/99-5]AKC73500.1 Hypothetical protein Cp226_0769 [Corynebacterium pseudotuberculosis]APX35860.1 alkylmercury lyase [Corynebacterium pseudotuberculosis]APX38620.1 alkylmercury lyase [Corynebacterium pseudotuberculosis]ARS61407.1 Hypothetical protein CpATCC19410_1998 [Corynebacterium pseudotuberculosis]
MHSVKSLSPSARDLHILLKGHTDGGVQQLADRLISPNPTPHLAHLSTGASVYTWCVLDTFILAGLFACDVQVESRPPLAAAPLNVSLISNTLTASPEFVVSFPLACDENGVHFTEAFCPFANLFPTIEHYRHWAPLQPRPTVAISVDRANSIAADFALDIRTNTIKSSDLSLSL